MDIVIRAAVIFLFLWFITRLAGRATLGELSSFELILYIVMGDLVAEAVVPQDYSATGAILAVGTMAVLTITISMLNTRWRSASTITHGVPVIVVHEGEVLHDVLHRERLGLDDLLAAARGQGIQLVREIRLAVLETNGQLSFFTADGGESGGSEKTAAG